MLYHIPVFELDLNMFGFSLKTSGSTWGLPKIYNLFLGLIITTQVVKGDSEPAPDNTGVGRLLPCEYIQLRGFICEQHKITPNNAVLNIYRIINPLADEATLNKYPVIYGHGVLYDASSMISRSEHSRPRKPLLGRPTIKYPTPEDPTDDNSLPFMFSNNNFDVWLFDSRGVNDNNRNKSTIYNIGESQHFWDFSLDEQALLDIPAILDYVLTRTGSRKVIYTGFSESTFFMFALLSDMPQVADKVAAFIALAPVTYVAHIQGFTIPFLAGVAEITPESFQYSVIPQPVIDGVDAVLRNLCRSKKTSNVICGSVSNSIGGFGSGKLNPDLFKDFFKSTSIRAIKHFLQLNLSQRFAKYDFGVMGNLRRYGQPQPPSYNLGNVRCDGIILVRGLADFLSDPKDQERLIRELGTAPYRDIVVPEYNHFDFIDGQNLINLVNEPVMIAVFQLMYKDGPNILMTPGQATLRAQFAQTRLQSTLQSTKMQAPQDRSMIRSHIIDDIEPLIIQGNELVKRILPIGL